jgi:hypothetical protein
VLKGLIGGAALIAVDPGAALAKPPIREMVTICDDGTDVQVEAKAVDRYLRKHPSAFLGVCNPCICIYDRYDPDEQAAYGSLCTTGGAGGLCSSGTGPGCTKDADCADSAPYTTCVIGDADCNEGGGMCAYILGDA